MQEIKPFKNLGSWWKGNIHTHSTNSDGKLSPGEIVELYKARGWDFIVFTEHELLTENSSLGDAGFLVLPGVELSVENSDPWRMYHIVGLKDMAVDSGSNFQNGHRFTVPRWEGKKTVQSVIDQLTDRNNLAILAHPIWSRMELEDFLDLHGYFAMEILNYGCELESRTGLCINYWDSLLRRGKRIWGVATDDCHHRLNDQCGGWVMVHARELTCSAILEALREGSFYSSSGPEIHNYEIVDGEVFIECSPVKAVHFITYEDIGCSSWAYGEGLLHSASYRLRGTEKYVRVECVDQFGNTAWTNPIFL
jgi:hypothetical protein